MSEKTFRTSSQNVGVRLALVLLILVSTLPLGVITIKQTQQDRLREIEETKAKFLALVKLLVLREKMLVNQTMIILQSLALSEPIKKMNVEEVNGLLRNILSSHLIYANFGLIGRDGYLLASALPVKEKVFLGDRLYFKRVIQNKGFSVGEYQIGRVTGKPGINFAYPVLDESGEIVAVLFAAMSLEWLQDFIRVSGSPLGSKFLLVDEGGSILMRYPFTEEKAGDKFEELSRMKEKLDFDTGTIIEKDEAGVLNLYTYAQLISSPGAMKAYAIFIIPEEIAFSQLRDRMNLELLVLLIVTSLALMGAWFMGDLLIVKPITRLLDATLKISKGELSTRINPQGLYGQFSLMGKAFNEMAENIEKDI